MTTSWQPLSHWIRDLVNDDVVAHDDDYDLGDDEDAADAKMINDNNDGNEDVTATIGKEKANYDNDDDMMMMMICT